MKRRPRPKPPAKPDPNTLSPVMAAAMAKIMAWGGTVERRPGGYWAKPGAAWTGSDFEGGSIATTTIVALVSRKKLAYSQYTTGRRGTFPIEAKA